MRLLARLERRFGRYAIPNVTLYLIIGQVFFWLTTFSKPEIMDRIVMIPALILNGEVWRLVTFIFTPPFQMHPVFMFFAMWLFYTMGTALEHTWGTFKYNAYLVLGYLLTVGVSFAFPELPATVTFIGGSVFLAFAHLYPKFTLYIMFILPVQVRWLALLTWIMYGITLITGSWQARLFVLAGVGNFLIFFGQDILDRLRTGRRRMREQAKHMASSQATAFHECVVCGRTDLTHPKLEFRYCSQCVGTPCYCEDHIRDHECITE
ncbi:MAG: rhomboid family intramembrane serine protease [Planctomycetota bacterium]|jgi:hypothetical protein